MKTNRFIAKKQIGIYTKLLFDAAQNEGDSEHVLEVCEEAKTILNAIRGNADLGATLKDPGYTDEQKAQIVQGTFKGFSPELINTLAVMVQRGELDYLPRIIDQLETRIADELNLLSVEAQTAVELDDRLRKKIKTKIETELGKKVLLKEHISNDLLGGIILKVRGECLDASLFTQAEKTREALKH